VASGLIGSSINSDKIKPIVVNTIAPERLNLLKSLERYPYPKTTTAIINIRVCSCILAPYFDSFFG
jgi:hypothetical protein